MPSDKHPGSDHPLHHRMSASNLNPSPSLYVRRFPSMLVAGMGLAMSAFNFDTPGFRAVDSLVISALTLSLLLAFIGGEDRWRKNSWIVIALGLIAGPLSFCAGIWMLVQMQRLSEWSLAGIIEAMLSIVLIVFLIRETSAALVSVKKAYGTGT